MIIFKGCLKIYIMFTQGVLVFKFPISISTQTQVQHWCQKSGAALIEKLKFSIGFENVGKIGVKSSWFIYFQALKVKSKLGNVNIHCLWVIIYLFFTSDVCVQSNNRDGSQWKIGAESFLTDDSYYCNSKYIFMIFILLQFASICFEYLCLL